MRAKGASAFLSEAAPPGVRRPAAFVEAPAGLLPPARSNQGWLTATRRGPSKRLEPQARAETMAGKGEAGHSALGATPRIGRTREMILPVTGTTFQPDVRKP